jgi:hypothetical protein
LAVSIPEAALSASPKKSGFSDALFGDYLDPRIILRDRFFESFVALPLALRAETI